MEKHWVVNVFVVCADNKVNANVANSQSLIANLICKCKVTNLVVVVDADNKVDANVDNDQRLISNLN